MKVNVVLGDKGAARSGYLNLDPTVREFDGERFPCAVNDFGELVVENEAEEVLALDVLDRIPKEHCPGVLAYWASRMALGGTLTVSVLDIEEFASHLQASPVPVSEIDSALYMRKSAHTLESLVGDIRALGLTIERPFWDGVRAVVVARRGEKP